MTTANNPVVTAEPCPFCASESIQHGPEFPCATCRACRATGPKGVAWADWNTRIQASPPPDEMVDKAKHAIFGVLAGRVMNETLLGYIIEASEEAARAALQSIGPMRGWEPIETAPKDGDGREIMVWAVCEDSGQGWCSIVRWHRDHWCGDEDGSVAPTHWMPLPNPPKSIGIEDQG